MITVKKLVGMKIVPEYRTVCFDGTIEDWRKLHRKRSPMSQEFCIPESPCNSCLNWAREQSEKKKEGKEVENNRL